MIDPHIEAVLAAMAESGFTLPDPITPASMREFLDNPIPGPPIEIEKQQDLTINTPDGGLPARLYHPAAGSVLPVVLFFHGGGWVHGTLDMYDRMCAALAVQTECAVVSVDYRLAPENPFPAAWSDALASLLWIKDNHVGLGVDPSRIALVGDSAGGNLAAALAQNAANDPAICCQVLFYPALDGRCDSPSFKAEHAGFLNPAQMRWYWDQYAPGELRNDPRASPAMATINSSVAPATLIAAGNDPLHDEGVAYAQKLQDASVNVKLHDYPGAIHGFVSLFGLVPLGDEALACAASALREAFFE